MKKMTKVSILSLAVVMLLSVSLSTVAFTPPANLLPADALTSSDKADDYFANVSTNAADYSYADGEYIMRVPESAKGTNWIATKDEITYSSYTISVDIRPLEYGTAGKVGGAALLLGTAANNAFPWHCIRFNFSALEQTVSFFGFEHKGGSYGYMDNPNYTVIRTGVDFEEKEWFNLKVEVTPAGSTVYLDGETFLEDRNARLPNSAGIKWVGLYPEGGTDGFDVKNFQITDKATSAKLLPADLFTAGQASAHLTKVEAATYTIEGGTEPMMRVPIVNNSNGWVYTKNPLPANSFTISADVKPLLKTGSTAYGGTGILLGKAADNRFPWFNLQFNYADGKVTVYVVEHLGTGYGYLKNFTDQPILTGVDFAVKEWYNIKIEVTAEGTEVYVDGQPIPAEGASKLPKLGEIKYIGLYPAGGTNGFWVKNVGMYNGVDLVFEAPSPTPTETPTVAPTETPTVAPTVAPTVVPTETPTVAPTEAPTDAPSATAGAASATPGVPNKPTGDASSMAVVMLAMLVGAGIVVFRKKACR